MKMMIPTQRIQKAREANNRLSEERRREEKRPLNYWGFSLLLLPRILEREIENCRERDDEEIMNLGFDAIG